MRISINKRLRISASTGVLALCAIVAGCNHTPAQPSSGEGDAPEQVPAQDVPNEAATIERSPTTVEVYHSPLYSNQSHQSKITAVGTNSHSGLASIELVVTIGKMTDCSDVDGYASALPCRATGATEQSHTCTFLGGPTTEFCTYDVNVTDESLISYYARISPVSGDLTTSREITFSGGKPLQDVAAPVWWHTSNPDGLPATSRMSLGIFPDVDFPKDFNDFSQDLPEL